VDVYWVGKRSQGSLFDLGITFNEHQIKRKNIRLVNRSEVERIVREEEKPKSFEQVLLRLDNLSRQSICLSNT